MHLRLPSSRLGCLLLTYALRDWTRRQELHLREVALQATAYSCSTTAWCWGDRLGLHQLQRGHGPRAIYFAFCHAIGTAGAIRTHKFLLLRELPLPDSATAAWKMVNRMGIDPITTA